MTTFRTDAAALSGLSDGLIRGVWVFVLILAPTVLALGAAAVLARRQRGRRVSVLGRVGQAISVALVLACPTVVVLQLASTPGNVARPVEAGLLSVMFAAEIGGYLWLVLRRPGPLGAWRHSGVLGSAAALAVVVVAVLTPRQHGPFGDFVVTGAVVLAAILAPLAAGGLVVVVWVLRHGEIRRSLRQGAVECLWAVLLSPLVFFSLDVLTTPDDVGHAAVVLTGICLVFGLALLLVGGWMARSGSARPPLTLR